MLQDVLLHWKDLLTAFGISLLPVFELRVGMVYAAARSVPFFAAAIVCFIGNILPIPFILLFLRRIFHFMERFSFTKKIVDWLNAHARKKAGKMRTALLFGLFLFVAIPLPGTGAWTGALIAAVLDIRMRKALPAIAAGVLGALIIMSTLSYLLPEIFSKFFFSV